MSQKEVKIRMTDITLSNKEVKKMKETKKPDEPLETAGRAQDDETQKRLKSLERGRLISDISILLISLTVFLHLVLDSNLENLIIECFGRICRFLYNLSVL